MEAKNAKAAEREFRAVRKRKAKEEKDCKSAARASEI